MNFIDKKMYGTTIKSVTYYWILLSSGMWYGVVR